MGNCEEISEKLSAWLDHELAPEEIAAVEAHLEACPACRSLRDSFDSVDGLVTRFDHAPEEALKLRIQDSLDLKDSPLDSSHHDSSHRDLSHLNRSHLDPSHREALPLRTPRSAWRRIISVATAALILIAVSLVILVTGDRADAENATARMIAIEEIQSQTLRDQEALLQTLEWDLSAMKMKVNCADLDPEKEKAMLQRIDELMGNVERVRLKDEQPKGDEQ